MQLVNHTTKLAWLSGKTATWFDHKRGRYVTAVVYEIQLNRNVQLNGFQSYCFVFLLELFIEYKQLIPLQMRLMA